MASLPAHARVFQAFDSGGLKTIHIKSKTRDHNDQHEANCSSRMRRAVVNSCTSP